MVPAFTIVDVLVVVTSLVIVLVETGRVVVLAAAVMTLVEVVKTSITSPQITAVGYCVGEQLTVPSLIVTVGAAAARGAS